MVDRMQVIFNNNQEDQGQRNALTLMEMMELGYEVDWPFKAAKGGRAPDML